MKNHSNFDSNCGSSTGLSPAQLRQAFGPGYQVALFREHPILTVDDGGADCRGGGF